MGTLILIGGGGHGVVVGEAARETGLVVAGVHDDDSGCAAARGPGAVPWLGPLAGFGGQGSWIMGLGDLPMRASVLARLASVGAVGVVHPSAVVASSASVGAGVFVGPRGVVHSRARVGEHAIVNTGAIVEHDCEVGANAHLAPGSVLGGAAVVGSGTLVGLGAVVLPGVRVGSGCVVGAGAVVRRNVDDGAWVVGVPARVIGGVANQG